MVSLLAFVRMHSDMPRFFCRGVSLRGWLAFPSVYAVLFPCCSFSYSYSDDLGSGSEWGVSSKSSDSSYEVSLVLSDLWEGMLQ